MSGFELDPRLAADSQLLAEGPLSQLRLMDDSRFDWLVLVPRVIAASELIDLDDEQQRLLLAEINQSSKLLRDHTRCGKLNIGALGNIVRQLHIHVLARNSDDAAWPGPVWGSGSMQRRGVASSEQRLRHLRANLQTEFWRHP